MSNGPQPCKSCDEVHFEANLNHGECVPCARSTTEALTSKVEKLRQRIASLASDPDIVSESGRAVLLEALRKAQHHIVRAELHGKHTQDRRDAREWLEKYGVSECDR